MSLYAIFISIIANVFLKATTINKNMYCIYVAIRYNTHIYDDSEIWLTPTSIIL